MTEVWINRLRGVALGLGAVTLAALGLAEIQFAAGDSVGGQALCGAAAVIGVCFVTDLSVLALGTRRASSLEEKKRMVGLVEPRPTLQERQLPTSIGPA